MFVHAGPPVETARILQVRRSRGSRIAGHSIRREPWGVPSLLSRWTMRCDPPGDGCAMSACSIFHGVCSWPGAYAPALERCPVLVVKDFKLHYNPALDGLRGVAILLVILSHSHAPLFDGAFFGVDLFFVLSGYLITSLLLMENESEGRIGFWRFYRRRFYRLMPALALFLEIGRASCRERV